MKVVVVGGGVIGLGVAWELARAGAEVTVVERDRPGLGGASLGNAGWISPALCAIPVPGPGVVPQALRWMLRADSPFLLRPRLDLSFARWLWDFRRACSPARFAAGMRALVAHDRSAGEALLAWREQGVEFELHQDGMVFAALSEAPVRAEHALYEQLREAGYPVDVELLDGPALRALEPALSDRVQAGMVSRDEWHVRPETLTAGLAAAVRRAGGEVRAQTTVARLGRRDGVWRVDDLEADRVVVAAGIWTRELLRPLGFLLPLEGAKGYSVTATGEGTRPRHAVYLIEAKVGCSPYDGAVRLAGTLELAGLDLSLTRARVDAVARSAERYLRWRPVSPELEWTGLRPFVPDGLPVIGRVPRQDGLFVSTGHGMSGVTMAAASARFLAPLVLEDREAPELRPLSPSRFA